MSKFRLLPLLLCLLALPSLAFSSARTLDDFESLEGWIVHPSKGATGRISSAEGVEGRSLALDFDLQGTHGHVIARRELSLDLPQNYRFTYELRGEAPDNNFEIKLIDEQDNVWWQKRLNITFPTKWSPQSLRKRHLSFAWGPEPGVPLKRIKAIEFVVSAGSGGKGRILIDQLRFHEIDDESRLKAVSTVSSSEGTVAPKLKTSGDGFLLGAWKAETGPAWLSIDLGCEREIGALILEWVPDMHASAYSVEFSDDGRQWRTVSTLRTGNGGRDSLHLPEEQARYLRISVSDRCALDSLQILPASAGVDANAFFQTLARLEPRGHYPRMFVPEQCYWTILGIPDDTNEFLMSESGAVEIAPRYAALEPFLYVDGKLLTWADVEVSHSLDKGYLPIPSVQWKTDKLTLDITAFAAGKTGSEGRLILSYRVRSGKSPYRGRLFLGLRPFQVNPPWQSLFQSAGWSRLSELRCTSEGMLADGHALVALSKPSGFGAASFAEGEIVEHLRKGVLPNSTTAKDEQGYASGALCFDFDLQANETKEFHLLAPFPENKTQTWGLLSEHEANRVVQSSQEEVRRLWESMLDRFHVRLPSKAQAVIDTVKSNLAYIFINQDGPRIQPGSRNYERSWIRDGSLTSTALLELGLAKEAQAFADWYSQFSFPDGKVPCVVDERGADPTDEHDSHGQLLYLFMQVYHFTHDDAWLQGKWPVVVKTVEHIQALRALRKTEEYRSGPPEKRVLYGLVPESISHEGYSAKPMHSYWDNFFILRGLKDAVHIAEILGKKDEAARFAAERDDCTRALYASIQLAMQLARIDTLPGCAELGDFDATSTTIALFPGGERGRLPEAALQRTFDRYFERFCQRRDGTLEWLDFTPYENRVIGTYVALGQKERVKATLDYFMSQRRPGAWNHWAEVVFRDPRLPKMLGDMPHTWCGSDYIRSVRSMFVYEREEDRSLVIAGGIPEDWILDPSGIEVSRLPTYHGLLNYSIRSVPVNRIGEQLLVTVGGDLTLPPGGLLLAPPLSKPVLELRGDCENKLTPEGFIRINRLPARLELSY